MIYRSGRPAVALVCLGLLGTDQGLIGWSGTVRWLRHWVKWQTGTGARFLEAVSAATPPGTSLEPQTRMASVLPYEAQSATPNEEADTGERAGALDSAIAAQSGVVC